MPEKYYPEACITQSCVQGQYGRVELLSSTSAFLSSYLISCSHIRLSKCYNSGMRVVDLRDLRSHTIAVSSTGSSMFTERNPELESGVVAVEPRSKLVDGRDTPTATCIVMVARLAEISCGIFNYLCILMIISYISAFWAWNSKCPADRVCRNFRSHYIPMARGRILPHESACFNVTNLRTFKHDVVR